MICFEVMTSLEILIDKWESIGVELRIIEYEDHCYLAKIVVPEEKRNQGIGTQILKELKECAGEKEVYCIPTIGYGATSKRRLKNFYKKNNIYIYRIKWGLYNVNIK